LLNAFTSDFMLKVATLAIVLITIPLFEVIGNKVDTINTTGKHYLKVQYAGNMGLMSVGIGKELLNNKISTDLNYGYLPKFINGARVHTFGVKTAFLIKRFMLSGIQPSIHLGAGINYAISANTYLRYPGYYPDDYYLPNAVHFSPFIRIAAGVPRTGKKFDKISFYTELATMEYEIYYAFLNKEVEFYEIWNICFGMTFHFRR